MQDFDTNRRAAQAGRRAKRHAFWTRVYHLIDGLFHIDPQEFQFFLRMLTKWSLIGGATGVLAGTASAVFLVSLDWATGFRLANPAILFLLPLAGFLVGWIYYRFAGAASQGNNLVIEEVHSNQARIPLRMAPLVLLGTVITHLFGGSAGREGTAIQMGASLADNLRRVLRLQLEDRRLIIMAGISGGFASVFGTPVAGFVFGMEVQSVGRIRYEGIIPCLVAAYVGDLVTRAWGVGHSHYPALVNIQIEPLLLFKVVLAGIAFGLTSVLFVELIHGIKHLLGHFVKYPPLRPLVGGVSIIALVLLLDTQDYLGLSLPLIHQSVGGEGVVTFAFLLKLIFTAITLGSGYLGGEVTPLFVIGSTLGYTLGRLLGVDSVFMASIGFVAVFAGASNTPLACALMGMELFGGGSPLYLILGCFIAYLASGHRGIYITQRVGTPKTSWSDIQIEESLGSVAERRGGWLPSLPGLNGDPAQRLVQSAMSRQIASVREDTFLPELVNSAIREGVRTLPVLNAQNVITGIITDNDLRRGGLDVNLTLLNQMTAEERAESLKKVQKKQARDIMSSPVTTISHVSRLTDAIDLLNAAKLKRLPVVDDAGHLLGLITRSDILREMTFIEPDELESRLFDWNAKVAYVNLEAVQTLPAAASLAKVVEMLQPENCKRIIVVDHSGKAVGIITENDLLARVQNGQRIQVLETLRGHLNQQDILSSQAAADIMTTPIITVRPDTLAYIALRELLENQIKRLPVVDADGHPVGMVGRAGLMRTLLRNALNNQT